MLTQVHNILDKAIRLNEGKAFVFAVNPRVKQLIIDLNTDDQLGKEGIDALSDSLGEYAPFTVVERENAGLQTDHIDFNFTGDYWKSWKINVNQKAIEISVDNARFDELVNDLGFAPEHVGLTNENLNKLTAVMLIEYQKFVKMKLAI